VIHCRREYVVVDEEIEEWRWHDMMAIRKGNVIGAKFPVRWSLIAEKDLRGSGKLESDEGRKDLVLIEVFW
jgi:hypothetical protein